MVEFKKIKPTRSKATLLEVLSQEAQVFSSMLDIPVDFEDRFAVDNNKRFEMALFRGAHISQKRGGAKAIYLSHLFRK